MEKKKRTPLNFEEFPEQFVNAILSAEDDNFWNHSGISISGLTRAAYQLVSTGRIQSGGSTITMQVARNYFLTFEKKFTRKFTEILLSLQLERDLPKEDILELYLNKIFLGKRAYGFEAAAQVYYGKSINELSLAQHAMLAGLPIAPSRYNPIANPERAKIRRDWIINRMADLGYITTEDKTAALAESMSAAPHGSVVGLNAPHIAEMARQEMISKYGLKAYTDGYKVLTTVQSDLQNQANSAVINGLIAYDQRHGYRGAEASIIIDQDNPNANLAALKKYKTVAELEPALVIAITEQDATLLLKDGNEIILGWEQGLSKARKFITENRRSAPPKTTTDVLAVGDIIRIHKNKDDWQLAQIPAAQGALVSLNPNNGAIQSLVGGFDFGRSNFNRVTQANRQPGSNFKPFLYAAAMANGFTPASIINDAPVVFEDSGLENTWRPENSSGKFYGPTTLRRALYLSRNLVSIRLLRAVGIDTVVNYADSFGFDSTILPRNLSLALGTQTNTPMDIVTAYASLANGGYKIEPYLIEQVKDIDGEIVFEANPTIVCKNCNQPNPLTDALEQEELTGLDTDASTEAEELNGLTPFDFLERKPSGANKPVKLAPQIADPRVIYLIDSILMDAVKRGTATKAKVLERSDIAGKTGTTNGPTDAWFSGYNPDVVTTTWVGFDQYDLLGRREFGGSAALPIWIDYMRAALEGKPDVPRPRPNGLVSARIDPTTGLLARPDQTNDVFETFLQENVPAASTNTSDPVDNPTEFNTLEEDGLF